MDRNRAPKSASALRLVALLTPSAAVTRSASSCPATTVGTGSPLTCPTCSRHFAGLGVARFEWPERLEWLADLPRTPVGKIDKKRLHTDIVAKLRAESPSG